MNTLLIEPDNIIDTRTVVTGRQHTHLTQIQRLAAGSSLKVGVINGRLGRGFITEIKDGQTSLELELTHSPPDPIPLTLVLALPRPKMLRRILQTVASMGVKCVHLVNAKRVEKSFWQSPSLEYQAIRNQFILGLEQACDTILPEIHLHPLFKPFVEDQLSALMKGHTAYVAHPYSEYRCPVDLTEPSLLAIGPEGGFIPYEIEKLCSCGFNSVHIGSRILRVETAIPALIARLYPL